MKVGCPLGVSAERISAGRTERRGLLKSTAFLPLGESPNCTGETLLGVPEGEGGE